MMQRLKMMMLLVLHNFFDKFDVPVFVQYMYLIHVKLLGLPTLTILNMIEDYGVRPSDIVGSGTIKMTEPLREGAEKSSQMMEKGTHIPKLGLKSLARYASNLLKVWDIELFRSRTIHKWTIMQFAHAAIDKPENHS